METCKGLRLISLLSKSSITMLLGKEKSSTEETMVAFKETFSLLPVKMPRLTAFWDQLLMHKVLIWYWNRIKLICKRIKSIVRATKYSKRMMDNLNLSAMELQFHQDLQILCNSTHCSPPYRRKMVKMNKNKKIQETTKWLEPFRTTFINSKTNCAINSFKGFRECSTNSDQVWLQSLQIMAKKLAHQRQSLQEIITNCNKQQQATPRAWTSCNRSKKCKSSNTWPRWTSWIQTS